MSVGAIRPSHILPGGLVSPWRRPVLTPFFPEVPGAGMGGGCPAGPGRPPCHRPPAPEAMLCLGGLPGSARLLEPLGSCTAPLPTGSGHWDPQGCTPSHEAPARVTVCSDSQLLLTPPSGPCPSPRAPEATFRGRERPGPGQLSSSAVELVRRREEVGPQGQLSVFWSCLPRGRSLADSGVGVGWGWWGRVG